MGFGYESKCLNYKELNKDKKEREFKNSMNECDECGKRSTFFNLRVGKRLCNICNNKFK
jgi:hypothetical protein